MNRRLFFVLAACASLGLAGPAAAAGDAAAGKALEKKCSGCHGAKGEGKGPNPPLAGMDYDKHVAAMEDYKTGKRKHKMMEMLVKKMSDKEIQDLAAYYATLK
jgi:cytochrome c553